MAEGMQDVDIRIEGRAGVITLNRPKALNALTYEMCLAIDAALIAWRDDPAVALVLIEGAGERAFCAGGDIAEMYARGTKGDFGYGRNFWRDEYRMNARIFEYPKPVISFLHGFVMGGGVGVGCHGSHRIVTETSQIAMPECGIGLIPDVGGSYLLAQAPGRLGDYLGTTGARMGPADAILAGFADHFLPEDRWPALRAALVETGDPAAIAKNVAQPPAGKLAGLRDLIDSAFAAEDMATLHARLAAAGDFGADTLKALDRAAPLSVAATLSLLRQLREGPSLRLALTLEYRFTYRSMDRADFLEGIRAQIIDKDRTPRWRHADGAVPEDEVAAMLAPLGDEELTFEEESA